MQAAGLLPAELDDVEQLDLGMHAIALVISSPVLQAAQAYSKGQDR